jgi:hypothetical protein
MRTILLGMIALSVAACGVDDPPPGNCMSDPGNDMCQTYPMLGGVHAHTVFLNFDGAHLIPTDTGDARRDASDLLRISATIPPLDPSRYGGDLEAVKNDIAQHTQELFSEFDMRIVTTRPTDTEDYVMVMVGGVASNIGAPDSARGFAPLDCSDGNSHDIVFVFADSLGGDFVEDPVGARRVVAAVVAQETAHSYGLVHTDNQSDVMFPYVEDPSHGQHFSSGYVVGISCSTNVKYQDSEKRMMQVLGPHK